MNLELILKNKYISRIGILMITIIFLIIIIKKYLTNTEVIIIDNDNVIKKSLIPDSGRGVFAQKDYKKGDVVEKCIVLLDYTEEISETIFNDYSWGDTHNDKKVSIIPVTGKCNLLNHKDVFNVDTEYDLDKTIMTMTANRDIKKGEELYNSYGGDYWESRQKN
jgi:uncharacterized protein